MATDEADRTAAADDHDRGDRYDDDDLAFDHAELLNGGDGLHSYELQEFDPSGEAGSHAGRPRRKRRRRRTSASTAASFQLYTPDEERAVVRKFDRRLVIFVAALYMLSFLDRSNIGNARVAGMDRDLQTTPPHEDWYEWALTAFYLAYIAFEWMSLLWRLVPAHIYVALIVLSWGVTASLQAVAVSYPMLVFLRALLGVGEAAFTGIPFYLSFFFRRHELAFRTAIFISAAPLATTFASSLAWVILKVGEGGPIAPWRLLFLIEGFPAVLVAAIAWNVIPDRPETAPYLTKREQLVARLRLRSEKPRPRKSDVEGGHGRTAAATNDGQATFPSSAQQQQHQPRQTGLRAREVLAVLLDPVAWLTALIFFLTNMAYSSLPVFLPTILTAMGHSAVTAQALAAPPYLLAFVTVLATAWASDRLQTRAWFVGAHALASALGYGVLAVAVGVDAGSPLRYWAVYPAAVGFFNVVVLTLAWSINNQRTESRQGGGFALLQLVGQCGPLVGTRLYPDRDAPFYRKGMAVCSMAMLGVCLLAIVLRFYLFILNRRMDVEEGVGGNGEEEEGMIAGEERDVEGEDEGLVGDGRSRRSAGEEKRFRYML